MQGDVVLQICCLILPALRRARAGPEAALAKLYSRIRARRPEPQQLAAATARIPEFQTVILFIYPLVNLATYYLIFYFAIIGSQVALLMIVVSIVHSALLCGAAGLTILRLRMLMPQLLLWTEFMRDNSLLQPIAANFIRDAYPGQELRLSYSRRLQRLRLERVNLAGIAAGIIHNFPAAITVRKRLIASLAVVSFLVWPLLILHLGVLFIFCAYSQVERGNLLGLILLPGLLAPLFGILRYHRLIFPGWLMREICLYNILKWHFGNEEESPGQA